MATKQGLVKRSKLEEFNNIQQRGILAITIERDDSLVSVKLSLSEDDQDILLSTKNGQSIRFPANDVRATGRSSMGVYGIKLSEGDEVVSMEILDKLETRSLLTITSLGYGKRTDILEYRQQSRAGSGIITIKTSEKSGEAIAVLLVSEEDQLMLVTNSGKLIAMKVSDLRISGRNTQGPRLISLAKEERVVSVSKNFAVDE